MGTKDRNTPSKHDPSQGFVFAKVPSAPEATASPDTSDRFVDSVTIASAKCLTSDKAGNAVFEAGEQQFEIRHFCPKSVLAGGVYDITISVSPPQ